MRIALADAPATEALGEALGPRLRPGDVVLLFGDLGAGKTTLVRGLHRGMGARGRVRSPSFTTLIEYPGTPPLHHFDLYRYEVAGPGFLTEFAEWLDGDGVSVLEWAERLDPPLARDHVRVTLETDGPGRMATLEVSGRALSARALLDRLDAGEGER